ncbi:sigma-70 family RNA polymerase sigma factor [Paenibacillus agri]|uniref:Sigma-70 family RNA polymerase sigma factor n=1 Tax=Paenibacillus agri TaxID=2744309 RepID=A0A850EQA4_9BACL|nr:sigma-70 family RNA polymerase sigma factor [Paenibacillus agri]NUU63135.1 sigma-70 family RNA polymerase sigma factor [Paenibacillus agri]
MEELYLTYKGYAFSIAYRMLGVVADAEDVVQDCFAELQRKDRSEIRNMKAYVAKGITNRCLNFLNSPRNKREAYEGEWLPEPVAEIYDGPEATAERKDTLSYAFLVLLERLTPTERAVFILREVFQYEYEDIAEMVDKSETNCRKIFSRAKRNLQPVPAGERTEPVIKHSREALMKRFIDAFDSYDINGMLELLGDHPVLISDGGGQVHTVLRPMIGRKGVAALLSSRRVLNRLRELEASFASVNGESHIIYRQHGEIVGVLCLELTRSGDRIQGVYLMLDPDKLSHVNP